MFLPLQMHLEKWENTVWQRKWIWATTPWPLNTSTWSSSEPRGTNTLPASLCSCVCECFSPCLSHFLCYSLPQVSLISVFCPPQHVSLWHWSFGTSFWTRSVTRHGLISFELMAPSRFLDHACKQNLTRTLQTGSLGLPCSVPEECIYKKMHKLFHCNCVILQYPIILPAN